MASDPCPVYGHHPYAAERCTACRAEWLETGVWPIGSQHPSAAPTTTRDVASLAACDYDRGDE